MSLTNTDNKTAFPSDGEKKAVSQASEKSTPHEHEHGCCYHHEAGHAEKSCGCGHHHGAEHCGCKHEDHDEEHHCCCAHDHEEKHEMCCHDHGEEGHDHCCEHGHTHEEGHHHDHDSCCCGHDHEHVENSMDTDWDVSGVDPSQYRLLFSTLGAIAGVKDVGLNPDGLKIIHTPEALPAIKQAFDANNLKLKMRTNEGKETTQIRIQQMDCPTEEGLIRKKLNGMKGVSGLQFNLMNRVLTRKECFRRLLLQSNLSITPRKFLRPMKSRNSPNSNRPRLPGGNTFSVL